jgi:hypothetical protein
MLQLMDSPEVGKIRWIPYHMMNVLIKFTSKLKADHFTRLLSIIYSHWEAFADAKERSGNGWERLFVSVLLIRCISGKFASLAFPDFDSRLQASDVSVSYNSPWGPDTSFDSSVVNDFVGGIAAPAQFPHVSIYYPSHASFEMYDIIVAVWFAASEKHLIGYQLKEGRELPKARANASFHTSYVVRGDAAKQASTANGWVRCGREEIDDFFGYSGQFWTPGRWKDLSKPQPSSSSASSTPSPSPSSSGHG